MPSTSKNKGSAFEREVAQLLNDIFETTEFARSPGSGAYFGGSNSTRKRGDHVKDVMVGDLITPKSFPYSIECKSYAAAHGPNPYNLISGSDRMMDTWLNQLMHDSNTKRAAPLLFFKITRRGTWVVALSTFGADLPCTKYHYNDYVFYIFRIEYLRQLAPYM